MASQKSYQGVGIHYGRYGPVVWLNSGISAIAFGGVALGTLVYLGEGIPRVQHDILVVLFFPGPRYYKQF